MTNLLSETNRRVDALKLTGSGVGCLDSFIRSANATGRPLDIITLQMARQIEERQPGARLTLIRMLDREIRRQQKHPAKVPEAA